MSIELRAWHVFVCRQRNWQLWAYWLANEGPILIEVPR